MRHALEERDCASSSWRIDVPETNTESPREHTIDGGFLWMGKRCISVANLNCIIGRQGNRKINNFRGDPMHYQ